MPRSLLLLLVLLSPVASAAIVVIVGNPDGLVQRPSFDVRGAFRGFKLIDHHGHGRTVHLPRPAPLDEALSLPDGDWAEITLLLDGPLVVSAGGGAPVTLSLPTLTVPLDAPDAGRVRLDWSLPDGAIAALEAGLTPDGLAGLLEDGSLALPSP